MAFSDPTQRMHSHDSFPQSPSEFQKPFSNYAPDFPRPWRIDDDTSFWQTYITEAEKYDKEMVDGWNRSLDNLLVFSGLFSGVNTAFIIETYKLLQSDPAEDTANMFRLFLKHRNDGYEFSDEDLGINSGAKTSAIRINAIFFASLSCSLLVALGAVQGKDWLTQYDHHGLAAKPHSVQARNRQKKLDGLERWRFRLLVSLLPLLMQLSLVLFMAGVIVFLWEISKDVAGVVMAFALVGFLAGTVSWVIAVRYSSSPFQTPLSTFLHKPVVAISVAIRNVIRRGKSPAVNLQFGIVWFRLSLRFSGVIKPIARFFNQLHAVGLKFLTLLKRMRLESEVRAELHQGEQTSAECVGWLFEQAEQPDVVLRTLNVASLLPPNHVLAAFNQRAGLLDRLATRYNSYVEDRVGKQSKISNPEDTVITGIALFHVLKAQWGMGLKGLKLPLSDHRIRGLTNPINSEDHNGCCTAENLDVVQQALAVVICCVEMLHPDSDGADDASFDDCFNYVSQHFNTPATIAIPTPNTLTSSATLNITVFPSGLFLDGVIACAVRHIRSQRWRVDWFKHYNIQKVLGCLRSVLEAKHPDEPSEETISHIAIVVAVIQLAQQSDHHIVQVIPGKGLNDILTAWYVVDKRETVFKNIILAFAMAGDINVDDEDTKHIYLALLRFLDVYLPKDMEVSKKSEWTSWWPEAMNLYPGVLTFLSQIRPEQTPLADVLRVFARLLPDDWQYDDIQEALDSRQTKEIYPQLHILSPNFHNLFPNRPDYGADVINLIVRSFKKSSGNIMYPPAAVQDSVVELLGWIVAYPGANDCLPAKIEPYQGYRYIPPFLFSVIQRKEEGSKVKGHSSRSNMIRRHATRHLLALAHMEAEIRTVASQVKLDSLLYIISNWKLISPWSGDGKADARLQEQINEGLIGMVISPFQRLLKPNRDAELKAHHIGDSALRGVMQVWRDARNESESPESQVLLGQRVIEEVVQYFEEHPSQQDLVSSESHTVDTVLNYLEVAQSKIQPGDIQNRLIATVGALNSIRQPWYRIFAEPSNVNAAS